MPCRAAISLLILLTGTGGLVAAPVDPATRNQKFQPGQAKSFSIMRPAQARVLGGEAKYPAAKVQKIAPVRSMRTPVEISRSSVQAPADAAVRPATTPAAGH